MQTLAGLAVLLAVFALLVALLMGVMHAAIRIGVLLVNAGVVAVNAHRARSGRARFERFDPLHWDEERARRPWRWFPLGERAG